MPLSARPSMFLTVAALAASLSAPAFSAVVLQEEQRIVLPEPYYGPTDVCLYQDDLLVIADRPADELSAWALIQFRRQGDGSWQFVNEIAAVVYDHNNDIWIDEELDCNGPLAAMTTPEGASYVVEHTAAGWQATELPGLSYASAASAYRDAVAIGVGATAVGVVRRNTAGQWEDLTYVFGNPGYQPDVELRGPSRVWLAATELVMNTDSYIPDGQNETVSDTQVFDLVNGAWRLTSTLLPRRMGAAVIDDRMALQMTAWSEPGEVGAFFVRNASGAWAVKHALLSDEEITPADALFTGERVYAQISRNFGEIALFQRESLRRYRHVATFSPSDIAADSFARLTQYSVYGEWLAATARRSVYLFRVPASLPTPQRLQYTFENNSTADWTFSGDASWGIVSTGGTRLLRQTRTSGMAFAILGTSQGDDQSIQADVRINELGAGTPWAGFVLRYTDPQNYYYLLVNRTSVQIRRIVNGAYQPIATAPLSLVLGRWYNFRLEAIGSRLRMFVNGQQVGEVIDEAHASGRAGMTMWRARTDYDNVIVTDSPRTVLLTDDFNPKFNGLPTPWTTIAPANAWSIVTLASGERVYRQNLISGGPRTVNGGMTGDQIVSVDVRPRAFNTSGGGWVGVMARYVDNFNNYFLMLNQNGRASVRKRVNGVYTVIEEVPFTVTPNTTYRVRIEAIGASLRIYVNERLLAEGVDADLATGRYGLVTFNATADFDNFMAIRP